MKAPCCRACAVRRRLRACRLASAFALGIASCAWTQPPAAPSPLVDSLKGPYRIAGTVVNASTGEPLRRAQVSVLAEEDSHAVESVLTDGNGRFVLPGLAAAKYQLTASRRGFRTAYFDEHDEYSTAIVTGEGLDTGSFTFRLTPGAILRGVITADGGDPVEGARVMLFRRPPAHKPGGRILQVDNTATDDTGAYEFSNLAAGEYLLAVTAEPWYALHRVPGGPAPAGDGADPLDVAYPVTFFDSTSDEASATPIVLAAGGSEQANVNLHAAPALHLFVQAPRQPNGSISHHELVQSIFGDQVSGFGFGLSGDSRRPGVIEYTGLPPGHYEFTQGDPPRVVELDATSSQQIDPAMGTPTVEVAGIIRDVSGSPLPPELRVNLQPIGEERTHEVAQASAVKGSFRLIEVPPGRWRVVAGSGAREVSVVAVAVGDRALAGNEIAVADKPVHLTVTISQAIQRIAGFARKDAKGFAGAMVVLVPGNLALMSELARRDQSDSDGSFSLRNVAAGQYTIVAIENGWDLDWSQPRVISRYLPRGTPVSVGDGPANTIRLSGPVQVQSP